MREDRPGIEERVGRALARGNMRQREGACDLDTIAALGMVGIQERIADAVYRLKYANDPRSYHDALAGVYGIARSLDIQLRWRMKRRRLHWMAKRVLNFWLNDGCATCTGVGYEVIKGSPHLSDRICRSCAGTRKRVMPWLRRLPRRPEGKRAGRGRIKRWKDVCRLLNDMMARHRLLLVALERSERAIAEKMAMKLRRAA